MGTTTDINKHNHWTPPTAGAAWLGILLSDLELEITITKKMSKRGEMG